MMRISTLRAMLVVTLGSLVLTAPVSGWAGPRKAPNEGKLRHAEELERDYLRLYGEGKYREAAELAELACSLLQEEHGKEATEFADCIDNLGVFYNEQREFGKSEPLLRRALVIRKKVLGEHHPNVASSLNNLSFAFYSQGEYEKAELLLGQALAIFEKNLGPRHPELATSLNNLASLYSIQGKYEKAEPLNERALLIREEALGAEHPLVADSLSALAILRDDQGKYEESEPLHNRALAIREKVLGPDHPAVAQSLSDLAWLYRTQGKYERAEPLFRRALTIREKMLDPDHPDVALSLNNLAWLYKAQGMYGMAEPLYIRALAIYEKIFGSDHPSVATTLNNLAELYRTQGAYGRAEPLFVRALTIVEREFGPDHPYIATTLNNLATLYSNQGEDEKAKPLFARALAIHEKLLGPDHPNVATGLENLASLYQDEGLHEEVEPMYQRALAIRERILGPDHPDVATSLMSLAWLYGNQGAYEKAKPLHERALAITERSLGPDHPEVAHALGNLAVLHYEQGNVRLALELHRRGLDIEETNLARKLVIADERRRLAYAAVMSGSLRYVLSLHLRVAPEHDAIAELALTTLLRRKNRVQDLVSQSTAVLRRSLPEDDRHLLDDISEVDSRFAVLTSGGPDKVKTAAFTQQINELVQQRDQLWHEMARHSDIVDALDHPIGIQDVQSAIIYGGVLIEFVQYVPHHDDSGVRVKKYDRQQPDRYAAYLVFPDHFDWVDLGPAAAIDDHIKAFRKTLQTKQAIPTDLYDAVMRPIVAKLDSTRRLIIAPAGDLSLIPFGALHDGERYLVEQYDLRYVTTGRDLLALPSSPPVTTSPVTIVANPTGALLPDAELEADFLEGFFPDARVLRGDHATETNVRTVERPLILHMATHGFFGEARNERDNPMLRSGLYLADIEQVEVNRDLDDGQLTAYEVSGMDLRGTQLVVLSACDTGMATATKAEGKVLMSEGVSGLRRAFAMAGARTTVMSLWDVSGVTAQQMMKAYYRTLAEGMGPGEAMQSVQLEMLHTKEHAHPKDWAVFVVSGDDDPLAFPAGQEPREDEPTERQGPPPVRRRHGCTIGDPSPDRDSSPGTLLLSLLGLVVVRCCRRQ